MQQTSEFTSAEMPPSFYTQMTLIGGSYITFGLLGFICNAATVIMIISNRVYRLSAYTLMANVALADSIILLVAGVACGCDIIWPDSLYVVDIERLRMPRAAHLLSDESLMQMLDVMNKTDRTGPHVSSFHLVLSFGIISAWTAGVISYALLGLNRCIAICYYGTKAKTLNRVSIAVLGSVTTWIVGFAAGIIGCSPEPLIGIRRDMWTISFMKTDGDRPTVFLIFIMAVSFLGVIAQWVCSTLVLLKIRQVKEKISRNKLNQNSANRFRKQARLTFQFFYPSILCTISTVVYFVKPFIHQNVTGWQFILLHMIWLCNHACNPFIYAYFNDRMRLTYREMLTCAAVRFECRKRKQGHPFRHNAKHNVSRRSNAPGAKSTRMSARSIRSRDSNFVRNSLQLQSRDFEQLCEFMMRVNPLYDSSEGWRESSDDEDSCKTEMVNRIDFHREATQSNRDDRESRSIVLDMGRQTVEHWVKFAKKASI